MICSISELQTARVTPTIQYRGGSAGFLKVIDEQTLGFADFGGNRQYITLGNLSENDKAFLFLMDYANSQRIKLWGTAKVVEDAPVLLRQLPDSAYPAKVERVILFTLKERNVNCSQHIHKRLSQAQIGTVLGQLQDRVRELELELKVLRRRLHDS